MTDRESRSPSFSYVPIFFVVLSFCTFLMVHIMGYGIGTKLESEKLKRLNSIAEVQMALLKEHRGIIEHSIEQLKPPLIQSEALQKRFTDMLGEVSALARSGDRDARKIIGPDYKKDAKVK